MTNYILPFYHSSFKWRKPANKRINQQIVESFLPHHTKA